MNKTTFWDTIIKSIDIPYPLEEVDNIGFIYGTAFIKFKNGETFYLEFSPCFNCDDESFNRLEL